MLLPLQGVRILSIHIPRALPWAMCLWAFSPYYYYFKNNYLQQIKTVSKIIIYNKTKIKTVSKIIIYNKTKWIQNNYR